MHGVLISCSAKRLAQLEEDPETLDDVLDARHETQIPGLLDVGSAWDALDVIVSDRGKDALLGDAIIGRTGRELDVDGDFETARLIAPARVAEIATKLEALGATLVKDRYASLAAAKAHGNVGAKPDDEERDALATLFRQVVTLYKDAAKQKQSMLLVII